MASPTEKAGEAENEKAEDPGTKYPPVEMKICPYDSNHVVKVLKFAMHVHKCYNRHCMEQASKNEEPLFVKCRYDCSHHIRKEEKEAHESTCKQNFTI